MATIVNRDRFPEVDFLPESEFKVIGEAEGELLVLLGKEQGTGSAIVATTDTPYFQNQDLQAVPLQSILKFAQGPVNITEKF
ncbi:MAG TPA: hypothetical protein V6C57_28060 [Coleofasciculaceae cyanobacterium]